MPIINRFPGGSASGGEGGIGTTMVIYRSHEGSEAPLTAPLQVEYYQEILPGPDFGSISLAQSATGTKVQAARSVNGRSVLQLDGFELLGDTEYDFDVPFGAVKDKLGNVLKGVYRYKFTTGSYQPILLVTPEISKAAFDAVIAAVNSTGGTVYFTEGEFRGLFPIEITHSDVSLIGEGSLTKIICDTSNSGDYVGVIGVTGTEAAPVKNVRIESMTIDGDYSSDNANRKYFGIWFQWVEDSTICGCIAENSNYGIYLYLSSSNIVTSNITQNNSNYGVFLNTFSNNNVVTENVVQSNGVYGIHLQSSSNNIIFSNTYQNNNGNGINMNPSSNNTTIIGNTSQNNSINGIYSNAPQVTILGNTVQNNSSYGIRASAQNNSIIGNTARGNGNNGLYVNGSNCILLANNVQSLNVSDGTGNINSQNITS